MGLISRVILLTALLVASMDAATIIQPVDSRVTITCTGTDVISITEAKFFTTQTPGGLKPCREDPRSQKGKALCNADQTCTFIANNERPSKADCTVVPRQVSITFDCVKNGTVTKPDVRAGFVSDLLD